MCESLIWYVRVCTIWCIILYIIYICCIILLNAECGIDLAVTLMKSPLGVALIRQWYYECRCRVMRQSSSDTHDITTGLCVIPWIKFITSQLVNNIWLNCEKLKKYMGTTNKERELYGLFGAALLYVFQVHSMFLR